SSVAGWFILTPVRDNRVQVASIRPGHGNRACAASALTRRQRPEAARSGCLPRPEAIGRACQLLRGGHVALAECLRQSEHRNHRIASKAQSVTGVRRLIEPQETPLLAWERGVHHERIV